MIHRWTNDTFEYRCCKHKEPKTQWSCDFKEVHFRLLHEPLSFPIRATWSIPKATQHDLWHLLVSFSVMHTHKLFLACVCLMIKLGITTWRVLPHLLKVLQQPLMTPPSFLFPSGKQKHNLPLQNKVAI